MFRQALFHFAQFHLGKVMDGTAVTVLIKDVKVRTILEIDIPKTNHIRTPRDLEIKLPGPGNLTGEILGKISADDLICRLRNFVR